MTKDVEIQDLSASKIEEILNSIGYGEDTIIRGAMDVTSVQKLSTDNENQITLFSNTFLIDPKICLESVHQSEKYCVAELANELYRIEQTYK